MSKADRKSPEGKPKAPPPETIAVTLGELKASVEALGELSSADLPMTLSFRIAPLLVEVNAKLKFAEDARLAAAKRLGVLNDTGDAYEFDAENLLVMQQELDDLGKQEAFFTFTPLRQSDFPKSLDIKPGILAQLKWMLKWD